MDASNTGEQPVQRENGRGKELSINFTSKTDNVADCNCCGTYDHDTASQISIGNGSSDSNNTTPLPQAQADLVDLICSAVATAPEPTIAETINDVELKTIRGAVNESTVQAIFQAKFGCWGQDRLNGQQCISKMHIDEEHIPGSTQKAPEHRVVRPKPDLLYGYSSNSFAEYELETIPKITANTQNLILPFLAMELKGQSTLSASGLCVAENQVVGAASACIKMIENLNHGFQDMDVDGPNRLDSTSFAVVANGTEARLFIAWTDEPQKYKMQHVRSYCLAEAEQWTSFHRAVYNIRCWVYSERLNAIRSVFDMAFKKGHAQQSEGLKRHAESTLASERRLSKRPRLRQE